MLHLEGYELYDVRAGGLGFYVEEEVARVFEVVDTVIRGYFLNLGHPSKFTCFTLLFR